MVQRISSLISLCFNELVRWQVCYSTIQFTDKYVLQQISSRMSLYSKGSVRWWLCVPANLFTDEVVWCNESVRWKVCASPNQFAEESVLLRICSLMSLWCNELVHWQVYDAADHFTNEIVSLVSLTNLRWSESVRSDLGGWRVCASADQEADEPVLQRMSSLTSLSFNESVYWRGWGAAK